MDWSSALTGLGGAVAGPIVGGVMNWLTGNDAAAQQKRQHQTMAYQHQLDLDSMDAQKANQWFLNQQQFLNQQDLNNAAFAQADKQQQASFNENRYLRDTQYQAGLNSAMKAGINPNLVGASSAQSLSPATASASGGSAQGGSASGGSGTSVPSPIRSMSVGEGFEGLKSVTGALVDLAVAKREGVNVDYLEKTLQSRVENEQARAEAQKAIAKWQDKLSEKQVEQLAAAINNLNKQGDLFVAETLVQGELLHKVSAEVDKLKEDKSMTALQRKVIQDYYDNYFKQAMIDRHNESVSRQNESNSSAALSSAHATTENATRQWNIQYAQYSAGIESIEYRLRSATSDEQKSALAAEYTEMVKRAGIVTEQLEAALKKAQADNDWYTFDKLVGACTSIAEAISMGAAAGVGVKGLRMSFKALPKIGFNR